MDTDSQKRKQRQGEGWSLAKGTHFLHETPWGRVLLGLILAGLVLAAKSGLVEHLSWYDTARLWIYEETQRVLSNQVQIDRPVTLVDISKIPKVDDSSTGPGGPAVSREYLIEALKSIAKAHPTAIGVDVDFSPEADGNLVTARDLDFFANCKSITSLTGVPIFLGVDRQANKRESNWLADSANRQIAAGLAIGNDKWQGIAGEMNGPLDRVLRMFCYTQSAGTNTRLRSLAFALSEASNASSQEPPTWIGWAMEFRSETIPDPALETEGFAVDFRLLDSLYRSAVPVSSASTAPTSLFAGRVVILGDVLRLSDDGRKTKRGDDIFRVPGRRGTLYSGALLQGCAVDTLIDSPLRQWTPAGRISADLGLAVCAVCLIEFLGWSFYVRRGKEHHHFRIHWSVTLGVVAVILVVAIPFVGTFRLVWDDVPFVGIGLLVHTGLDQLLAEAVHRKGLFAEPEKHDNGQVEIPVE